MNVEKFVEWLNEALEKSFCDLGDVPDQNSWLAGTSVGEIEILNYIKEKIENGDFK